MKMVLNLGLILLLAGCGSDPVAMNDLSPDLAGLPDLAPVTIAIPVTRTWGPCAGGPGAAQAKYDTGLDATTLHDGMPAAFMKSNTTVTASEFGCLGSDQRVSALGPRVRLSADIKTAGVVNSAGLWLRLDGKSGILQFDNMADRPLVGTLDWARYSDVLDAGADVTSIAFGIIISGEGEAWVDNAVLEEVDSSVATTD